MGWGPIIFLPQFLKLNNKSVTTKLKIVKNYVTSFINGPQAKQSIQNRCKNCTALVQKNPNFTSGYKTVCPEKKYLALYGFTIFPTLNVFDSSNAVLGMAFIVDSSNAVLGMAFTPPPP
jgi:hypothetical protein